MRVCWMWRCIGCVTINQSLSILVTSSALLHRIELLFFPKCTSESLLSKSINSNEFIAPSNHSKQRFVLSKYETKQIPKKIFEDLNNAVSYPTVKRWCKVIEKASAIPFTYHRTVRTKANIQKLKRREKDFLEKIGTWNGHVFLECLENS